MGFAAGQWRPALDKTTLGFRLCERAVDQFYDSRWIVEAKPIEWLDIGNVLRDVSFGDPI